MASLSNRLLANKRFEFSSAAFAADKFAVVEMEGFEAISQPFRFTLTLVSDDASIDFDTMLTHPATFVIYGPDGRTATPYHGVLCEFDQLHRADGYVFYQAVLVPNLWNLSLYRISEVYLDEQPITTTLETVLKSGQLNPGDFEFKLTGTYRSRSFVCQYEETHLDFVSRWMEHEGIYYYFDHSGNTERLIVLDNHLMHDADAVKIQYRPDDEMDTGVSGSSVRDFVCRQKPLPKEVILQDYNHRRAALQLKASAVVAQNGRGQVVLYGENFRNAEEGNRYAKLRAEEILCAGKVFSGEGSEVGLRSGYFAELSHHYREDFNGQYLVTEIHHRGSQAGALLSGIRSPYGDGAQGGETSYSNSFRAIAAAVQFRPERVTPKPRVAGTMNATIDSEGNGPYAELDEYGQYKVQLPFDLTDKSADKGSARVRMATPYSGSDHGMHFPLHKGAEVLLSFIDGDPDRPVIVGAVPNSVNRSLVNEQNPEDNRIRTAGGSELHMSDAENRKEVALSTAAGNQVYMRDEGSQPVMWMQSPYRNSAIGIGATSTPDAGGGTATAADDRDGILIRSEGDVVTHASGASSTVVRKNQDSVVIGTNNQVVAGARAVIVGGIDATYTAGASFKGFLGANLTFNTGVELMMRAAASHTVNFSKNVEWGLADRKMVAAGTVTISGGDPAANASKLVSIPTGAAIAAAVAVQAAIAAAAAAEPFTPGDNQKLDYAEYAVGPGAALVGVVAKFVQSLISAPGATGNGKLELDKTGATLSATTVTVDAVAEVTIKAPDNFTLEAATDATLEVGTGSLTMKSPTSSIQIGDGINIKSTTFGVDALGTLSLNADGVVQIG
jgi:type VI secretion system secreted protein VgrG